MVWFGYCLTSRLTIFQSCRDGTKASWVFTSTLESLKCLAQGHYMAVIGFVPWTPRSGVRCSTTEPPRHANQTRYWKSLKGFENEAFPVKIWHLKCSFLSFAKFAIFAKFSITHILSLLLTTRYQWYTVTYCF